MAELYIGFGTTAVILYVIYQMYKDDYEDFFKFWELYVLLIKSQVVDTRFIFTTLQYESIKVV